ncbi:MAG: pyrimidine/purine nucleoside phosphorylase [Deltaproteobacteria bacterium]|nr:pyrimidine/purine nucleoside phosphorylase [Deltaproteobacteria bacterium]
MSQFENVTVVREANVYFGGNVTSRTVLFADGSKKTLGVMMPGDYEFGTGAPERMEILAGDLDVLLPGQTAWKTVKGGEAFDVAGNAKFQLRVRTLADYCCSYLAE